MSTSAAGAALAQEASPGLAASDPEREASPLASLTEEGAPSAILEELANVLAGLADAHPAQMQTARVEMVDLLRRISSRVQAVETECGEMRSMFEIMHMLSGRALQASGGLGGDEGGPLRLRKAAQSEEEETTRSFMVKKGDAELQEQHRLAASQRPSQLTRQTSPGNPTGGTLSTASSPMSKEDMDKARGKAVPKVLHTGKRLAPHHPESLARRSCSQMDFMLPAVNFLAFQPGHESFCHVRKSSLRQPSCRGQPLGIRT